MNKKLKTRTSHLTKEISKMRENRFQTLNKFLKRNMKKLIQCKKWKEETAKFLAKKRVYTYNGGEEKVGSV